MSVLGSFGLEGAAVVVPLPLAGSTQHGQCRAVPWGEGLVPWAPSTQQLEPPKEQLAGTKEHRQGPHCLQRSRHSPPPAPGSLPSSALAWLSCPQRGTV